MDPDAERECALATLKVSYRMASDQRDMAHEMTCRHMPQCDPFSLIGHNVVDPSKSELYKILGLVSGVSYMYGNREIDTAEIRRLTDALLSGCVRVLPPQPNKSA